MFKKNKMVILIIDSKEGVYLGALILIYVSGFYFLINGNAMAGFTLLGLSLVLTLLKRHNHKTFGFILHNLV